MGASGAKGEIAVAQAAGLHASTGLHAASGLYAGNAVRGNSIFDVTVKESMAIWIARG